MASNIGNNKLLGIFIGLLVIVGAIKFWPTGEKEGKLKSNLIKPIDSGQINRIEVLPEFDTNDQVILVKKDQKWQIKRGDTYKDVDPKRLKRSLNDLYDNLAINRLVSRNEKDWEEYEVDSSGSLLRIYSDGDLYDEVILGKMKFVDRNQASNYVREPGENTVYAVEGYLDGSLKGTPKDWMKGKGSKGPASGQGLSPAMRQKLQKKKQLRQRMQEMKKNE